MSAPMERLLGELGIQHANALASTIAIVILMQLQRDHRLLPSNTELAQRSWGVLTMLADRVRGNQQTLMEQHEPQLVESVMRWCARHMDIMPEVDLRPLI